MIYDRLYEKEKFDNALLDLKQIKKVNPEEYVKTTEQYLIVSNETCRYLQIITNYDLIIQRLENCLKIDKSKYDINILPIIYENDDPTDSYSNQVKAFLKTLESESKDLQQMLAQKIIKYLDEFIEMEANYTETLKSLINDNEIQQYLQDIQIKLEKASLSDTNELYIEARTKIAKSVETLKYNFKKIAEDNLYEIQQYSDDTSVLMAAKLAKTIQKAENITQMGNCAISSSNALGIANNINKPTSSIAVENQAPSRTLD